MSYYDDAKNIDEYIQMSAGYDGAAIIKRLENHLTNGSTVLELGMGPGKDLDILSQHYQATGSDTSTEFLNRYRANHSTSNTLKLDAITIKTERKFDAIYSNKVLQHLHPKEIETSIATQAIRLNNNGLICHSLWKGDGEETYGDTHCTYYQPKLFESILAKYFDIIEIQTYREMEDEDSFWVIARLKAAHSHHYANV